ncbi:pyridoxal phosphate-dependent decarboxylase family protein [Flagellimonas myxillae]|uniref:pyridoxal phosphate-dependent decarboxylase family protein n=1 Tax=Flagellimonas myxillae TaxID=2942214 RepID=UPI00201F2A3D|nr:aminotransferase class I/II-fold pyridoxal phosphate-dependent enzyme [Muricauda myxillae]MCL6265534.1 aminotransferase class I/II-fold pyridoxal phosphate-dependent enzyme [Muricauda myxillae]
MDKKLLDSVYDASTFKNHGDQLVQLLAHHLNNASRGSSKTIDWNLPEDELAFWNSFLETGKMDDFFPEILKRTTHVHNPKYVGHQVAVPAPITALTGLIASMLNNGMAVYEMGMSPTAMERIVCDLLGQNIGYSENSRGILTSGGTLANLTALLAARKAKVESNVWNNGHTGPLAIMVSEEAHYCVDRAAKIMGLGDAGIIKVPVTEDFTMDVSQLETRYQQAIANGVQVFAIVGSAPSTATGIYDNLVAIGQFAGKHNLWFHVDGAHGGAAIFSKKYKHLLQGIEHSDSVVIDGHKMLMMPTITTALIFKEGQHSHTTFSQKADYLLTDTDEEDWYNGGKRTFECTKSMMSLHWYILLKMYGEEVFDQNVTQLYDLAEAFAQLIQNDLHFELAIQPMSNILCFRYVDENLNLEELNQLNQTIRQILLEDGEYYLVQTKLRGIHYLRTTLMNPFTTMEHLGQLIHKIKQEAHKLLTNNPS